MSECTVISLAEWRERHHPPEDPPPAAPQLRVVGSEEHVGQVFRLETFLARARVVMGESARAADRPALRAVPSL
jgi:hypothetical protein